MHHFKEKLYSIGKTGLYTIILTLLLSAQSLAITFSKTPDDTGKLVYKYDTTTTILNAEIFKFLIALTWLILENQGVGFRINPETIMYALPAFIYFVQNNLVFIALKFVDATTYQVLVNLKIITTGILFRYVLKRYLSSLQWSALVLLFVGCATSQISTNCDKQMNDIFAVPMTGIVICIILSFLSAAAGISTEWIMKNSSLKTDPLQRQNLHLYFFGIIFNFIGYVYQRDITKSYFEGYNPTTVIVVICYTFAGMLVSVIMKYADNMVKIYSVSVSMALTMVLSVIFIPGFEATLQLFFGIVIISLSLLMYFNVVGPSPMNNPPTIKKDHEVKNDIENQVLEVNSKTIRKDPSR